MRILIETDDMKPAVVTTAGAVAATALSEAADGGAGPSGASSPSSDANSEGEDTGGPPQWLLDAVAKDMATSATYGTGARDEGDGGAGPNRRKRMPRRTER
jgi:hypothetical protein